MQDSEARDLLQRQVQMTIAELLAVETDTWNDPIPLPEMVYSQLEMSWHLREMELYLALLRKYAGILESLGPFQRFDSHLMRVLMYPAINGSDVILFADIRTRWLIQRGEFDSAELLLVRLWEAAVTPALQAYVANREGVYWKERSEFNKSLDLFQLAVAHTQATQQQGLLAMIYNNLGNWAFAKDDYEAALRYYQQAWKEAIAVASVRILGGVAGGLAMTLEALKRYSEAYEYLDIAEAHYRDADFRPGLVRILLNRGFIDAQLNQIERAKQSCGEALMLAREFGDTQRESTALHNLGFAYAQAQDWENALLFYERALRERRRLAHTLLIETTLLEIGKVSDAIQNDTTLFEADRVAFIKKCTELLEDSF